MQNKIKQRIIVYIDGFNLYGGIRQKYEHKYKWLNVELLAQKLIKEGLLIQVKLFTAKLNGNKPCVKNQSIYLNALKKHCTKTQIIYGFFEKARKCKHCNHKNFEEKQTDVNIACEMLKDAYQDEYFIGANFKFSQVDKQQDIKSLLKKRNASQPIGQSNCGSVFKNPPNHHAAKLIEESALKGFCIGGACISDKHANFIINQNNASASDIENLITHIQQTVKSTFDIELETEVVVI